MALQLHFARSALGVRCVPRIAFISQHHRWHVKELYPEYQCHPCNPWSLSLGFGAWDLGFTAGGSVHGRK